MLHNFFPFKQNQIRYSTAYLALIMALTPLFNLNVAGRGLFLYLGIILVLFLPSLGPYRYLSALTASYVLFAGYDLLTFLWSPSGTDNDFSQYIKMILFVLIIIMTVFSEKETSFVLFGQLIMGAVVALILATSSTTMVVQGQYLTDTSRTILRIGDVQLDPNYTCMLLIPLSVYLMKVLLNNKKIVTFLVSLIMYGVIIFGCLRTGSRGGLLAILVASAFYFLKERKATFKKMALILGGIVAIIFIFPIALNYLPESVARRFTLINLVTSGGSGRQEMWLTCLSHVADSALTLFLGHGKGATLALLGLNSHNFFIDALYNGGIIELFLLIRMFVYLFKKLSGNIYGTALLAGYLCMSMTVSVGANMFFWTGMALVFIFAQNGDSVIDLEDYEINGGEV